MGALPTPPLNARAVANPCAQSLALWLNQLSQPLPEGASLGVAYSAGADSTALLLAAKALWGKRVVALHVNHGLQNAAGDFEHHAMEFCQAHDIALRIATPTVLVQKGQSLEEQARLARYQALAALARHTPNCEVVLLAQHAQDQLETILLALSRGAGLPGISAMGSNFVRHGQRFARPILDVQAASLREWLTNAGHGFVDDPSNTDLSLTRNRIRAQVLPALEQALPGVAMAAARSAQHAAQAHGLLTDYARLHAQTTGLPPTLKALQALLASSEAAGINLLRYWLAQTPGATPSTAQLRQLVLQVKACTTRGHAIDIKVGGGHVRRVGDKLAYSPPII